jgi:hypothetical protein
MTIGDTETERSMKKDVQQPRPSTIVVYRPDPEIAGIRLVQDDAARIAVVMVPISKISALGVRRDLLGPGRTFDAACAYAWADGSQVYFGETQGIVGRLKDHAKKHAMSWGAEAFVVSTFDGYLDKPAVLRMQHAFSEAAKRAGLMHVVEGVRPSTQVLAPARAAAIDRMIRDAYPLFYDAGLRAFHSNNRPALHRVGFAHPGAEQGDDPREDFAIEIGAAIGPDVTAEAQLTYANIWAHGYACGPAKFVVGIGSEVRTAINQSTNPIFVGRRLKMMQEGALVPIYGVNDRMRLVATVGVESPAVAAKIVCGAHVNSGLWKMQPLRSAP